MLIPIQYYDPRYFWSSLSFLEKLYALLLAVASLYLLQSLTRILLTLHQFRKSRSQDDTAASSRKSLVALQNRLDNARQLLLFAFYLFAFCFLLQVPAAFSSLALSKASPLHEWVMKLGTLFLYSADVAFVLLLLHSFQWFVSSRLRSMTRKTSNITAASPPDHRSLIAPS